MNPITRKSISELVSFRSLTAFEQVANIMNYRHSKTAKTAKKCMVAAVVPCNIHFFVDFEMFGNMLLVQYLTKPIETL